MIAANSPHIEQAIPLLTTGLSIVGTASLTILIFIVGQIFMKFAEPAFKLREEIGAIAQDLEMYVGSEDFEPLLRVGKLFRLPQRQNVEKACAELFGLSNMQMEPKEKRTVKGPYATGLRIRELLNSRPLTEGEKGFLARTEA